MSLVVTLSVIVMETDLWHTKNITPNCSLNYCNKTRSYGWKKILLQSPPCYYTSYQVMPKKKPPLKKTQTKTAQHVFDDGKVVLPVKKKQEKKLF